MLSVGGTALLGLLGRSRPPQMGGFEQRRGSTTALGQARLGLLVSGSAAVVEELQQVCRGQVSTDGPVVGVIYQLTADSAEVVAEGEREALVLLARRVAALGAEAAGAEVREAWQQPLAETGDEAEFPLVLLAPKMRAHIVLAGTPDALDIISSQLQVPQLRVSPHEEDVRRVYVP